MKKTITLLSTLLVLTSAVFSAQIRSNKSGGGNWNSTLTWAGGVLPGSSDQVVIEAGDSVFVTDSRTCDQLIILMDVAGKAVLNVTSSGTLTVSTTTNLNLVQVDPFSFAGPWESRIIVDGTMNIDNLNMSSTFQTNVDIDVDGTLSITDELTYVFSSLGRNCDATIDVTSNGDMSCGSFDFTSALLDNDFTLTNENIFDCTGNFLVSINEDNDFTVNANSRVDFQGQLRSIIANDNSRAIYNVRDSLIIGGILRLDVNTTALATDNQINLDFAGAYTSWTFTVFNGKGGSINGTLANESTVEQGGTSGGTYIRINENISYHNFNVSNTNGGGVYVLDDTLTTANFHGDLTVGSGSTFLSQGSTSSPKSTGINGNIINNGTFTDRGAGLTVNGDVTNNSVFNLQGSVVTIGGNLTNTGTFNIPTNSDKIAITGNFNNSSTFDADLDSLVIGGNFTNSSTYTSTVNNIYLDGDWDNTGTYTFATGDIVSFEGSATQAITGTTIFYDMRVDNAAGVDINSGSTSIKKLLTVTNGALDTKGNMTFISDATETAGLAELGGGGSITGNVTVERFLNEGDGWYLLASPVTGATLADWNVELPMSGFTGSDEVNNPFISVYNYDETSRGASNLADSGYTGATNITNSLTPGEGWFVYYEDVKAGATANTMDVTGPLQTGSVTLSGLSFTFGLPDPSLNGGWHMVGNPYASPVEWAAVTKSGIESNEAYVMGSDGNYQSVVADNVDYLYSSEGFWIHVDILVGVGSLTFDEADKSNQVDDYNARHGASPFHLPLKMDLEAASEPGYLDYSVLRFADDTAFSEDYDGIEGEARKIANALGTFPNIATSSSVGEDIYYNTLSSFDETGTIPIRIWQRYPDFKMETYTVTFNDVDQWELNNKCVILTDTVAKVSKKLTASDNSYTFSAMDTLSAPRLFLSYSTPLEVVVNDPSCFGFGDGSATITGDGAGATHTYTWLNENGDEVHKDKSIVGSSSFNQLSAGTYTVWVTNNGECGTMAATITIEDPEPVVAEFTSDNDTVFMNANTTILFTNSSINATEYFWDFGDGNTSTMENPAHTYTSGGVFEVMMIATEDMTCADTLFKTIFVVDNVGISEVDNDDELINIYQANGETFVEFNFIQPTDATIDMFDMLGRSVIEPVKVSQATNRKIRLHITNDLVGIYTIGVYTDQDYFSKKLYYKKR